MSILRPIILERNSCILPYLQKAVSRAEAGAAAASAPSFTVTVTPLPNLFAPVGVADDPSSGLAKGYLYQWQNIWIALLTTLELQEVIIVAARPVGIFTTDLRPAVIDCAAARGRIKELARFTEEMIALAPQDSLSAMHLRIALLGHFYGDSEKSRQPIEITL
jgi:hypothetical protein